MKSSQTGWSPKPVEIRNDRIFTETIEINATWHCNIRCRWCSHASPDLNEQYADPASIATSLTILAKFLRADHLRILGGEPLLHPDLNKLIRTVRSTGISNKVRVLTNGLMLHRASNEFWELVDEVHISVYPSTAKVIENHKAALRATAEAHNVALMLKNFDHFRVSYRAESDDYNLTERIYRTCQIANLWRCLTLHDGNLYRCPQAVFLQALSNHALGGQKVEYLEIDSIGSAKEIEQWLYRETALNSCTSCTGSAGKLVPHELVQSRGEPTITFDPDSIDSNYLQLLESDLVASNSCVEQEVVENGY